MLELAHREHGRLPWADLFAPAIELAENGFEVSPRLFGLLNGFKRFARGDDFRRYFYDASGEPHPVGYRLEEPRVRGGAASCSRRAAPSRCTRASSRPPSPPRSATTTCGRANDAAGSRVVRGARLGAAVHAVSGVARLRAAAAVVGRRDDAASARHAVARSSCRTFAREPVQAIHLFAEANRLAFADRNLYLGDPSSWRRPSPALLDAELLARARGADRSRPRRWRRRARRAAAGGGLGLRAGRRVGAAVDEPLLDRRPLRRRRRDDDERAGRVRQPAHGRRLHLEQPAHGLRLRADGRRQARRESRRRRQAAAVEHVADDAARRARAAAPARRLAGRHAHHRLRRAEHRRRRRLGARRAASRRRAALPRRGRAHRARGRHRARGSRAGARGARAQRRAERHEQRPARDRDRVHAPRRACCSAASIRAARAPRSATSAGSAGSSRSRAGRAPAARSPCRN